MESERTRGSEEMRNIAYVVYGICLGVFSSAVVSKGLGVPPIEAWLVVFGVHTASAIFTFMMTVNADE